MDSFEEKESFKNVKIIRLNNNKIKISWNSELGLEKINVYWSKTPSIHGQLEHIKTLSGEDSIIFDDPDMKRRSFFILTAAGYVPEIVAEVLIPFQGAANFRDLGGYKTTDGRRLKWNILYRSNKLAGLTTEDICYLKSLGIRTIIDYRSKAEVANKPDPLIEGVDNINISGMPSLDNNDGNFDLISLIKNNKGLDLLDKASEFLIKGYKEMVLHNKAFKILMECIENPDKTPIVQHCTAGKDRTGFGSALILLVLGVPEDTVIEDYLLTNTYRANINETIIKSLNLNTESIEKVKMLIEARREYIESSLNVIKENYGSFDDYFESEYGLTKEKRIKLQRYYLE